MNKTKQHTTNQIDINISTFYRHLKIKRFRLTKD